MTQLTFFYFFRAALFGALFLVIPTQMTFAAMSCGPGAHWVDTCTAGTDTINSSVVAFGVDIDLDNSPDFDAIFSNGSFSVLRSDPLDDSLNFPGLRPVDAHLDVIDTEMVSMNLMGSNAAAAGWALRVGTGEGIALQSLGAIAELPANPLLADSFFDIFFEIDGTPFGTIHNNDPLRVSAIIDRVPPVVGTRYINLDIIDLFDSSDTLVARLTPDFYDPATANFGHHIITPIPATFWLMGSALLGLFGLGRKRHV